MFQITVQANWNDEMTWALEVPGTGHHERTVESLNKIYKIEHPDGSKVKMTVLTELLARP